MLKWERTKLKKHAHIIIRNWKQYYLNYVSSYIIPKIKDVSNFTLTEQ